MQHAMQPPILTSHDGGGDTNDDSEAYRLLVGACETALTTLCVSDECAATLRRCAHAARRIGERPPRELHPVPAARRQAG